MLDPMAFRVGNSASTKVFRKLLEITDTVYFG